MIMTKFILIPLLEFDKVFELAFSHFLANQVNPLMKTICL